MAAGTYLERVRIDTGSGGELSLSAGWTHEFTVPGGATILDAGDAVACAPQEPQCGREPAEAHELPADLAARVGRGR